MSGNYPTFFYVFSPDQEVKWKRPDHDSKVEPLEPRTECSNGQRPFSSSSWRSSPQKKVVSPTLFFLFCPLINNEDWKAWMRRRQTAASIAITGCREAIVSCQLILTFLSSLSILNWPTDVISFSTLVSLTSITFILAVLLTAIAFICCRRYWKDRDSASSNRNLEIHETHFYRMACSSSSNVPLVHHSGTSSSVSTGLYPSASFHSAQVQANPSAVAAISYGHQLQQASPSCPEGNMIQNSIPSSLINSYLQSYQLQQLNQAQHHNHNSGVPAYPLSSIRSVSPLLHSRSSGGLLHLLEDGPLHHLLMNRENGVVITEFLPPPPYRSQSSIQELITSSSDHPVTVVTSPACDDQMADSNNQHRQQNDQNENESESGIGSNDNNDGNESSNTPDQSNVIMNHQNNHHLHHHGRHHRHHRENNNDLNLNSQSIIGITRSNHHSTKKAKPLWRKLSQ